MFYAFQALLQWFSGHCSAPFFLLCPEVLSGQSRKKGMFIFGLLPRTALRLSWAIFVRPAGTGEMAGKMGVMGSLTREQTARNSGPLLQYLRSFALSAVMKCPGPYGQND